MSWPQLLQSDLHYISIYGNMDNVCATHARGFIVHPGDHPGRLPSQERQLTMPGFKRVC